MKIYTSYFYQIRFFTKNMIPISTALSDPKWYHNFQGPTHIFLDKNRVINGIRCEQLHPDDTCKDLCKGQKGCKYTPDSCEFLKRYSIQLNKLDISAFKRWIEYLYNGYSAALKTKDIKLVFIFHETSSNPCSERVPFTNWCKSNKIEVEEWSK